MSLATFVQVSDLHFGDMNPNGMDGTYDADAPRYWKHLKVCEGLLGHTVAAMEHLDDFFANEPDAHLVVAGDLTCTGKGAQFAMAEQYLGNEVTFPAGNAYGLRSPTWRHRCIGGNHDQWNERLPLLRSGTSPSYLAQFPPGTFPDVAPDVRVRLSDRTPLRIRFIMVDSDAEVGTNRLSGRRILARGKFGGQLADPAIALGRRGPDEIRVLLIHHSPTYPALSSRLRMHHACRQALDRYLIEQDISVVMCGHIHVPKVRPFFVYDPGSGLMRDVLEARSGTATQRDEIPARWVLSQRQWANWRLPQNTLLVHRLREVDDAGRPAVDWTTSLYWRDRSGFVPLGSGEVTVRVWP